jgi:hypothetical protein
MDIPLSDPFRIFGAPAATIRRRLSIGIAQCKGVPGGVKAPSAVRRLECV